MTSCVTSGHGRAPDGHPIEHWCPSQTQLTQRVHVVRKWERIAVSSDRRFSLREVRMMETSIEMAFPNRCPVSAASALYTYNADPLVRVRVPGPQIQAPDIAQTHIPQCLVFKVY